MLILDNFLCYTQIENNYTYPICLEEIKKETSSNSSSTKELYEKKKKGRYMDMIASMLCLFSKSLQKRSTNI